VIVTPPPLVPAGTCTDEARPPLVAGSDPVVTVAPPAAEAIPVAAVLPLFGVTEPVAVEALLVPAAFVAVTAKVYAVPFARFRTIAVVVEPSVVATCPPGEAVTVYAVTGLPPSEAGATQLTDADWSPAAATAPLGGAEHRVGGTDVEVVEQ
jgi:hypothetical protein